MHFSVKGVFQMKTRLLAVLLVLGFLVGNFPVAAAGEWTTEAPPLSDLVSHWDGHIRLVSYDLGPSPTPPPPGEKAACDPQIYAAVLAAFEEMKALGSIPAELNISSTAPDAGTLELIMHYSPQGTPTPASSKPTSIPFHYQDGSLSAQMEESGMQMRLAAWATRTTFYSLGVVDSSSITIAGNVKLIDPNTGKVIAYYSFVTEQEGSQVPRGELLGYNLNLAPGTDARTVEFLPFDGKEWQPLTKEGFPLRAGDRLRTKDPKNIVSVWLNDGEFTIYKTRIAHGTISFGKVTDAPTGKAAKIMIESIPAMAVGMLMEIWSEIKNPPPAEVHTKNVITTILGTAAVIEESESETSVKVLEGTVQTFAYGNGASQVLAAGQAIAGNDQGLSAVASFDMAAELAKWGPLEGIETPTGFSPSFTSPPTPLSTSSGTFLGLATQWWIVIGAGLGLLLLALLVLVLILRSGRPRRQVLPAYSVPMIPGPAPTHCRACGAVLLAGQRFCGSCGGDSLMVVAPPVAPPVVPAGAVCPACSRPVVPGDRFCQGCGSTLPGGVA
jgi:hypothetical protein